MKREMIFEHLFCDNFFILTLFFTLFLYCFGFRTNAYFFFVNYGFFINYQLNDCSNYTTYTFNNLSKMYFKHFGIGIYGAKLLWWVNRLAPCWCHFSFKKRSIGVTLSILWKL